MNIFEQVVDVCESRSQRIFSAKEVIDFVEEKFRSNKSSVIPSDYCYNRINQGIDFTRHAFVLAEGKYRFVGKDFSYSGAISAGGKKERVVGLWKNGKFCLWEDFPKVSKVHPKRTLGKFVEFVELATHESNFQNQIDRSLRDSASARQIRLKGSAKIPAKVAVVTHVYIRNSDVVAEIIVRANGKCEKCGKAAPFHKRKDGTPYLEVHHKTPLAKGGEDTVENAVALCPNCHREQHFGVPVRQ